MHTTHTFVTLTVSKQTYDEIKKKLMKADYTHVLTEVHHPNQKPQECIDMHGIGLVKETLT